jgi:hypothetical protein
VNLYNDSLKVSGSALMKLRGKPYLALAERFEECGAVSDDD